MIKIKVTREINAIIKTLPKPVKTEFNRLIEKEINEALDTAGLNPDQFTIKTEIVIKARKKKTVKELDIRKTN